MSELSLWILAAVATAIFGALVACLFMRSRTIAVQVQLTATESQLNEMTTVKLEQALAAQQRGTGLHETPNASV